MLSYNGKTLCVIFWVTNIYLNREQNNKDSFNLRKMRERGFLMKKVPDTKDGKLSEMHSVTMSESVNGSSLSYNARFRTTNKTVSNSGNSLKNKTEENLLFQEWTEKYKQ